MPATNEIILGIDTSGSMSRETIEEMHREVKQIFAVVERERLIHRAWQRKAKPERHRNRIRRVSRRINRLKRRAK